MRDSFADIAALAEVDVREVPDAYSEAMRSAYWEDKDLSAAMAVAWAGISRLLVLAHEGDAEGELRSRVKALVYDMASFTWAGWDEPGIVITPAEARAGHDAARANLGLAIELEKGDLPRSRAYWMLGAHELAAGLVEEAQTSFDAAADLADRAGPDALAESHLARAFSLLAAIVQGRADESELTSALESLAALPDGEAYSRQVTTARSALGLDARATLQATDERG